MGAAEHELCVREVAELAGLPARVASDILFELWRLGLAGRRWDGDGPRRFYPITEAGRAQLAEAERTVAS
jgi:hypothetical protein